MKVVSNDLAIISPAGAIRSQLPAYQNVRFQNPEHPDFGEHPRKHSRELSTKKFAILLPQASRDMKITITAGPLRSRASPQHHTMVTAA